MLLRFHLSRWIFVLSSHLLDNLAVWISGSEILCLQNFEGSALLAPPSRGTAELSRAILILRPFSFFPLFPLFPLFLSFFLYFLSRSFYGLLLGPSKLRWGFILHVAWYKSIFICCVGHAVGPFSLSSLVLFPGSFLKLFYCWFLPLFYIFSSLFLEVL